MENVTFKTDVAFESSLTKLKAGETIDKICFIGAVDANSKPVRMILEGEALGEIIVSEFGHSVLCRVTTPEHITTLENFEDIASSLLPEDIEFKNFLQDEKFFLKLKTKNDKYNATIDPPANPLAVDKSPFHHQSVIELECAPSLWVNFGTKTSGLFMKIYKVTVDGGRKKRRNR